MKRASKIIIALVLSIILFFLFFLPAFSTAYGIVTGKLDIETLEPSGTKQSDIHPCGGY